MIFTLTGRMWTDRASVKRMLEANGHKVSAPVQAAGYLVVGGDMMDAGGNVTTLSAKLRAATTRGKSKGILHHSRLFTTLAHELKHGYSSSRFEAGILASVVVPKWAESASAVPAPGVVDTPEDLEALAATLAEVEDVFGDI